MMFPRRCSFQTLALPLILLLSFMIAGCAKAPKPPTDLMATPDDQCVSLTWSPSAKATGYKVYMSDSASGQFTHQMDATSTSANVTGLTNDTEYFFVVTAVNEKGKESDYSNIVSATPALLPPPAPTGVMATAGDRQVTLEWNTTPRATSYWVLATTDLAEPFVYNKSVTGTSTTITGLTNGTTYYFKIRALNSSVQSEDSAMVQATPQPAPPAAPTSLTATPGDSRVTLQWTGSAGATDYKIYKGTAPGSYTEAATTTGTNFVLNGLTNGTTHYFVVTAVRDGVESTYSNMAQAVPSAIGSSYSISGIVRDPQGNPIPNLVLSFGSTFGTTTTNALGQWNMSGLIGTVTITPIRSYWSFSPRTRTASSAAGNLNFTAKPDQLVYVVSENTYPSDYSIKVSNLDGSGTVTLLSTSTSEIGGVRWSPDGTKIAFWRNWGIYVMNADGTGEKRLTSSTESFRYPSWSPDGTKIVGYKQDDSTLWIMDAATENQTTASMTKLNVPSTLRASQPTWSPDGQLIGYQAYDPDGGPWAPWRVYMFNRSTSVNTCLTPSTTNYTEQPEWSRDGTRMVFRMGTRLGVVTTGGVLTDLSSLSGDYHHPCWTSDGSQVIVSSSRTIVGQPSRYRIWSMNPDGTNIELRIDTGHYNIRGLSCSPPLAP